MKRKQTDIILADLKRGWKVSGKTAYERHSIYRLSEVIRKLRAQGYQIETTMVDVFDDDGNKITSYGEYSLRR